MPLTSLGKIFGVFTETTKGENNKLFLPDKHTIVNWNLVS